MKRIIATVICIALIATMAISGSVAYLTDEELDENVFQVGSVDIVQHEQERSDSGLVDFTPNDKKHPMVESTTETEKNVSQTLDSTDTITLRNPEFYKNYVDKIVTVENVGASDAYIRNIVAIPTGLPKGDTSNVKWLEVDWLDAATSENSDWTKLDPITDVAIEGHLYDLYVFEYKGFNNGGLKPGKGYSTLPTLLGFGLSKYVNYDENANPATYYYQKPGEERVDISFNPEKVKILVATQAVQVAGFESYDHAFSEAFGGAITATNHPWYNEATANEKTPISVSGTTDRVTNYFSSVNSTDNINLTGSGKDSTTLYTYDYENLGSNPTYDTPLDAEGLTISNMTIDASLGYGVYGNDFEMEDCNVLLLPMQNGFFVAKPADEDQSMTNATFTNTSFLGGGVNGSLQFAVADTANSVIKIDNCTFDVRNFNNTNIGGSGIQAEKGLNGKIEISNSTINAITGPALSISNISGNPKGNVSVSNTTINFKKVDDSGSPSVKVANVSTAKFSEVTFNNQLASGNGKIVVTSNNAVFDGCHFSGTFDLQHDGYGVTFKNCTFGTEETTLTSENFSQVFTCTSAGAHTFDNTTT
ncbi:MAG: right-handed parallel beta-helix repeat-containing protein [Clostridia bacterium]|nr:right-handed parallel beta-helix repeat-containing protein [Clostridia bacterium]